jgi:hypothetical protein
MEGPVETIVGELGISGGWCRAIRDFRLGAQGSVQRRLERSYDLNLTLPDEGSLYSTLALCMMFSGDLLELALMFPRPERRLSCIAR